MLGEELLLSWSMSLGSLLSSSLMLRPSELSPSPSPSPSHSEGESGRLSSCGTEEEKKKKDERHYTESTVSTLTPVNKHRGQTHLCLGLFGAGPLRLLCV